MTAAALELFMLKLDKKTLKLRYPLHAVAGMANAFL